MRRLFAWLVVASAVFGALVLIGIFAGGSSKPAAGCIPTTQILTQLRQEKPGGENYKAPYDKNEIATIKAQEIAWVQTHLDETCVRSMAAHVHVKVADLPNWLQKASLKKVGKTGLAWYYHGKRIFNLDGSVYAPPKPKKTTAAAQCASTVHYYVLANHNFGTALKGSTPQARLHDLQSRYTACKGDPLLTADNARAMKVPGFAGLSDAQVRTAAKYLVAHPADWRKLVKVLVAKENKDFRSDVLLSGEYRTGYMVPQHNGMPMLGTTQLSSTHRALKFQVGSTTVYLQEPCGGQPRVQVKAPVYTVTAYHPNQPTTGAGCTSKCGSTPPPHHQRPPKGCTTGSSSCGHQPPPKHHKPPKGCQGKGTCKPPPPHKGCKVTHTCPPPPPPPPCKCTTPGQVDGVTGPQQNGQVPVSALAPTKGAPSQTPQPNPVATTTPGGKAPAPAPDNGAGKTAGYAGSGAGGTTPGGSTSDSGGTIAGSGSTATSSPSTGLTGTYSGSPTGPPS